MRSSTRARRDTLVVFSLSTRKGFHMTALDSSAFRESNHVTSRFLIASFLLVALAQAKDVPVHESGTLLQMNSVECGFDQKSSSSFASELIGTDSEHKKT